jgi:hypothetical protein
MKLIVFAIAATAGMPGAALAATNSAAVYDAGRCIVQQDRHAANALMTTLPLDDSQADLSQLRGRAAACAAPLAGAPAMQVRGALAQAMFATDFRGFGHDPNPRYAFINLNLPVESSPAGSRSVELYRWADCVVRNDSAGAERLLHSAVASEEESAALTGLQDYMAACMPAGAQLTARRWELRSVLAQSAYHTLYRYWTGQLQTARAGN